RLAEDHTHAALLADAVRAIDGLSLRQPSVETNIVFFEVSPHLGTAAEFCGRMKQRGVLLMAENAKTIRAVTHLDVDREQIEYVCATLAEVAEEPIGAKPTTTARSAYA
ncbi:MAG TPA: low specificity L-threonine aldolase, partial [Pirellulales bacterium]|nr:low specificity L-threonine aldolase [Pirellulales bacterium]